MMRRRIFILLALAACGADPIEQPALLEGSTPFRYPVDMWDRGLEGQTVLLVHVNTDGVVDSALVHESSGFEAFDSAALAGVTSLRFAPGRRGARNADMWARLPVRFSRTARQSAADSTGATDAAAARDAAANAGGGA